MKLKLIGALIIAFAEESINAQYQLTYSDTLMILGKKSYETLDLLGAKEKLDSCILLNPKNDECKYYRAKIEYDMKSYQLAAIMFKNVLALNERDASSWHMLGLCFTNLKHFDSAEFCFKNAVQLNSKRSDFFANWANNQFLSGKLKHSEELYNTAILLDDKNAEYFINRAEIRSKMGNKEDAKADLELALNLDPSNSDIKGRLNDSEDILLKAIYGLIGTVLLIFFIFLWRRRNMSTSHTSIFTNSD